MSVISTAPIFLPFLKCFCCYCCFGFNLVLLCIHRISNKQRQVNNLFWSFILLLLFFFNFYVLWNNIYWKITKYDFFFGFNLNDTDCSKCPRSKVTADCIGFRVDICKSVINIPFKSIWTIKYSFGNYKSIGGC